jgi:predicted MFS family arabinose efflux permease
MSIMNLGAGLSTLVGPLIVGVFTGLIGYTGVAWIMCVLYVSVGFAIWYVTPRRQSETETATMVQASR